MNQTQIVTSITTSGYRAESILRRCLTRGLPECTGEIGLTRKTQRQGDIGQRPIRIGEQVLGALQTPCADIPDWAREGDVSAAEVPFRTTDGAAQIVAVRQGLGMTTSSVQELHFVIALPTFRIGLQRRPAGVTTA